MYLFSIAYNFALNHGNSLFGYENFKEFVTLMNLLTCIKSTYFYINLIDLNRQSNYGVFYKYHTKIIIMLKQTFLKCKFPDNKFIVDEFNQLIPNFTFLMNNLRKIENMARNLYLPSETIKTDLLLKNYKDILNVFIYLFHLKFFVIEKKFKNIEKIYSILLEIKVLVDDVALKSNKFL
ncbi:hypothetical protein HERIO_2493 [Hepatospora eriocheir]|uniref:Uncharacterized protein n=1 Tax=Hepatospora eriocheir TaxID=1081669 RepID=A0A1X0Q6S9_9MICR|nr:hypothetical protein HERIO_2493 [Hepatospora eriocheir]